MNQYNDWEGTPMDPGCMPCPNGTYNTEYGQSECLSCPNGYFCTPFGTVTPTNYDYNSWSSSANMKWTLLPDAEWEMEVPILGPLGEEDIETAVLQMAMLIIILMVLMMLFVKKCMRTKDWEKFKSAIKFVDRKLHISDLAEDGDIDEEEEEEFGAGETEADYAPKGKLIGGFAAIAYFFVVLGLLASTAWTFLYFNVEVTQVLKPKDSSETKEFAKNETKHEICSFRVSFRLAYFGLNL